MPISFERLYAACVRLHAAAENNHRVRGFAAPLLVFLPEAGPEDFVLVPEGIPPQQVLDAFARRANAVAILTTGEAWVSVPGLTAQAMAALTPEDLPRPADDPDRAEEIVTHAVGVGPDGATMVLTRASRIRRTPFGTMIGDPVDGRPGIRRDGATEALAAALRPPAQRPGGQARPTRTAEEMPMPAPAPHDEPDPSACPGCSVSVGALHTDTCCVGWCAATGRQRRDRCDTARGCRTDPRRDCRTAWGGEQPGLSDARRLGWYAVHTPDGWTSAAPETPGAVEDLNRLIAEGVWDDEQQRYRPPGADPGAAASGGDTGRED